MNDGGVKAARLPEKSSGHPVDRHVGQRLRMRRLALGMSQTDLGERLGITFQQIQKYERGSNRVSASRLYDIAGVFMVPVSYFYEGLPHPGTPLDALAAAAVEDRGTYAASAEGRQLVIAMSDIPQPLRSRILRLVTAIAESQSIASGDQK